MVKISKARIDLENARLEQAVFKDYGERIFNITATSTTTLDISQANVFRILHGTDINVLNVTNPASSGTATSITIIRQKDNSATPRSISWPLAFKWSNGIQPTLTQTASALDVVTAITNDGGLTWYAFAAIDTSNPLSGATLRTLYAWGLGTSGQLGNNGGGFSADWLTVSGGDCHSLALKTDSTLWAWGMNDSTSGSGNLGDNTTISKSAPVQIGSVTWRAIAAGMSHSLAVRSDSTLWAWGSNDVGGTGAGQLGDNTTLRKSSPTQIGTLATWATVAAGDCHSLAVKTDGTLWSWGRDDNGGLGSGQLGLEGTDASHRSSPTQVGTLAVWATVAAAAQTSFATKTDGTLWSWGSSQVNGFVTGHLGVNDAVSRSSPAQIGTLTTWQGVDAGRCHALAIKTDSTLWAWGANTGGRVGDGLVADRSSPIQIGTLAQWSQVSAGRSHSIARKTDSTLWAWGVNDNGQLGDGVTTSKSSPSQIGTLATWSSLAAGSTHTIGVAASFLFGWGSNSRGQVGDVTIVSRSQPVQVGQNPVSTSSPVQVGTLTDWLTVQAGSSHSLALRSNRTLWAWGLNTNGRLGDNTTTDKSSPVQIGTLGGWSSLVGGISHSFALRTDSTLWAWGLNGSGIGRLGDNTTTDKSSPVQIGTRADWSQIQTDDEFALALQADGTLWSWGENVTGQLGSNVTVDRSSPAQIGTLATWAIISTGSEVGYALKTDSTLWSWGRGVLGAKGDNTTTDKSSPVQVGTLAEWMRVAGGSSFAVALRRDSTLWTWGVGSGGRLGDNTTVDKSSPVQIGTLKEWSAIAISPAGGAVLARKTDNTLWGWGGNSGGALGDSTVAGKSSPVQIGTLAVWTDSSLGAHGLGIIAESEGFTADTVPVSADEAPFSRLFTWGTGTSGQLGNSLSGTSVSPKQVGTLNEWSVVSAGVTHSLALKTDSTLWAWGANTGSGPLIGDNTTIAKSSPVQIGTLATWLAVSAALSHSLALKTDSTLWAWGANTSGVGRLGDNTTIAKSSPVQIGTLATWLAVSAGQSHSLAVQTDSTLWAWGVAGSGVGRLGDNTTIAKSSPSQVGTLATWLAVSAALSHSLALKTDSTLWAWGANYTNVNQVGTNDNVSRSSPVQLGTLVDWARVSVGRFHSLAVKTDSTLWAWGANGGVIAGLGGVVGNNTTSNVSSPAQIGTLATWAFVHAGDSHSLAVKTDGTLWGWGNRTNGQLGTESATNLSSPTQIGTLNTWLRVSAGGSHSLSILSGNSLYVWGLGTSGQLGDNSSGISFSPAQIGTLTRWRQIAAGASASHILALQSDSTLWAWGLNSSGQLGERTTLSKSSPVQVGGFPTWSQVSSGLNQELAIAADGTLWAWGVGTSGVSGIGSTTTVSAPVQVGTLSDWRLVSTSPQNHTLAIKTDGSLWSWGDNGNGRLGSDSVAHRSSPAQVGTLTDWRTIVAATNHSLAVRANSTLWAWGYNASGQLGDGGTTSRSSPVQVGTLADWSTIGGASQFSIATRSDGSLWAWGVNSSGQLGDGTTVTKNSPVQVGTLSVWSNAAAGATASSYALRTDGTLWSWGLNTNAQLGDGTVLSRSSPAQIGTLSNWKAVSAGGSHALALFSTRLYGWGLNTSGQVGLHDVGTVLSPTQVGTLATWSSVEAGASHVVALKTDSTLWAWGQNAAATGTIGDNTTVAKSSPTQVGTLADWLQVAGGDTFTIARKTDSTLWAWGRGSDGVHGTNTTTAKSSPAQVGTLSTWFQISANSCHVVAIQTDSTLWAWGLASSAIGRLGDNTTVSKSSPVQIGTLATWSKVSVGLSHNLAIKTDSTLWAWGANSSNSGELGDGTTVPKSSPVQIGTLAQWAQVSAGGSHSAAIKTDGTLWSWGADLTTGALGSNATVTRSSPAQIGTLTDWAFVTIGSSANATFARKTNGTLWAWGLNTSGRLGDGTEIAKSSPVQIGTLANWTALGFRGPQAFGINASKLFSWGLGTLGQLGDNKSGTINSPSQVGTLSDWGAISGGGSHSFARKADQTISGWGGNASGQLGNSSTVLRSSPVQVGAIPVWSFSRVGAAFSLAVGTDSTLWTWGLGSSGQLGSGQANSASLPIQIGSFNNVTSAAAGATNAAMVAGGALWAWGAGTSGQIGNGAIVTISSPVQVGTLTNWQTVVAGDAFLSGLRQDSTLWTWGINSVFQLGIGSGTNSPRQVGTLNAWSLASAGASHSTAVRTDSTLWAWGINSSAIGQLGDNTVISKSSPTQIGTLADWLRVKAGTCHNLAIKVDSTLWSWGSLGSGADGRLGHNISAATGNRSSPTQIGTLTEWAFVDVGFSHSLALKTDSTLWAWGSNTAASGHLGDSTTIPKSSPTQIGTLGDWAQISANFSHNLAIKTDSTLWVWGQNTNTVGQTGLNISAATGSRSSPTQIGTLATWSLISVGQSHSLALKTDSTLWAWGLGSSGQLGDGATTPKSSPVQIGTLATWAAIGAGSFQSAAVKTDGTLWTWGLGTSGQLGDGAAPGSVVYAKSSPAQVGTLTTWLSVHGGSSHTLARFVNQGLYAWGSDASGQLGLNEIDAHRASPTQVAGTWTSVSNGAIHALGIRNDSTLWAWGGGTSGQLGNNTITTIGSPVQVGTLSGWVNVAGVGSHSFAVRSDSTLWAWGVGTGGALGFGDSSTSVSSPVQIGTLADWTAIAGGTNFGSGLRTEG